MRCAPPLIALSALATACAPVPPAVTAPAAQSAPLPLNIGGRVISDDAGGLRFGWPGTYFEGRFSGTGLRVHFEAPTDHMRLLVDGEERTVFRRPGAVDLELAQLPAGTHTVRLEKLTESQTGGGRFLGFHALPAGAALPPLARQRQIEFIGDSYTVGYGNRSAGRTCTPAEVHDLTDTQQAFGPLAARQLEADYRVNAFSGFGIVRNYGGGSPGQSLPYLYPRLKPDEPAHLEPAEGNWRPQVIVINLGTNDFSTPLKPGERWATEAALRADYRATYEAFVRGLHARHPQARFILMASESFLDDVRAIASTLNAQRPSLATPLPFGGLDLQGCDWHPSLADHRKLADLVRSAIASP